MAIKRYTGPSVSKGFQLAYGDVRAKKRWLIYPGRDPYPGPHGVEVLPLREAVARLRT